VGLQGFAFCFIIIHNWPLLIKVVMVLILIKAEIKQKRTVHGVCDTATAYDIYAKKQES